MTSSHHSRLGGCDVGERVEIPVDAEEVVDRVEEMLAWMMVASQDEHLVFEQAHLYRARPYVLLPDGVYGVLTPSSVVAYDDSCLAEQHSELLARVERGVESRNKVASKLELVKGIRVAEMVEADPTIGVRLGLKTLTGSAVNFETVKDRVRNEIGEDASSEGVDRIVKEELRRSFDSETGTWRGAKFSLHSFGERTPLLSRRIAAQLRLPQTARMFLVQHLVMLGNGQTVASTQEFGLWNSALFDTQRRPLENTDPIRFMALDALAEVEARREAWEVELSFGRKRTGVSLQTDAIGARAFVNMLRKEHCQAGRRSALVHWVREHMRRRRADDRESTVLVNAHLRGQASVSMGAREARIWPSSNAIERARHGVRYAQP